MRGNKAEGGGGERSPDPSPCAAGRGCGVKQPGLPVLGPGSRGPAAAPWGAGSGSGGAGAAGGGRGRGLGACAVRPGGAGTRRTRGEGGAARAGRRRAGPKREGAGPGRAGPSGTAAEAAGRRPGVSGRAGPGAEERRARRPGRGAMAAAETKIIYHLDEQETPYLVKLPIPAERVTLGDFKGLLNRPNYKFYFKSMDDDFG